MPPGMAMAAVKVKALLSIGPIASLVSDIRALLLVSLPIILADNHHAAVESKISLKVLFDPSHVVQL